MYNFTEAYGFFSLMALILGSMVLGVILMRWEVAICWARIMYLEQRKLPTIEEMRDGVLILFAGMMMIIPGIITDVLGLLLFLPPIRWVVRKLFLRNLYFEAPQGMGTHFQMYTFMTSNAPRGAQNYSNDGQDDDPEGFPREDANNSDKDVQIIDVVATDPNKKTNVIEDEKKEKNEYDSKSED